MSDEMQSSILTWLRETQFASHTVSRLTGGSANFVYRADLILPLDDGTSSVLIKHGEGYMAVAPANKINIERCRVEYECLVHLASFRVPPSPKSELRFTTRTPRPYLFSPSTNTQIHELLPSSIDLKTYILQTYSAPTPPFFQPQCHALGKALAEYLAGVHAATDEALREAARANGDMRKLKHMINFDWLVERVDMFPGKLEDAREVFERVREMAKNEMDGEERELSFIHGDACPGNFLLPNAPLQASIPVSVFAVDWEQAQLGSPALDHGEMIGELYAFWLYKQMDAGLWLMQGYIEGMGQLSEDAAWRTLLQVGVHLLAFTTIAGWSQEKEKVESVVGLAKDVVVGAWGRERKFFEGGPLAGLLK